MGYPHTSVLAWPSLFACLMLQSATHAYASAEQASNGIKASQQASIQLTFSKQAATAIRLEARTAPLVQILKAIANMTGAIIHYSVLPEAPVTATCAGANVGQIMDCLVAKQVGLVAHKSQKALSAEFWLLGSSVGSCQAVTVAASPLTTQPIAEQAPTAEEQAAVDQGSQDQSDTLLGQFKNSKDKGERAEALNNLASVGKLDDPNVRKALEDAMMDKDDSIRAQAVETLSNLDKGNSTDYLNRALQDKSPEVRMTALGKAGDQIELLERSLTDTDKNVSQYAATLLTDLKKQSGR